MELEGFEPSSKRGTNELSTCLVSTWFSCGDRQETTNHCLILCVSRRVARLSSPYFRFNCTTWSIRLGKRTIGWCLVSATVAEIKLIYYSSIKQRERSCFRHLNCRRLWFKSVGVITLHAYSPPLHAVKASQPRVSCLLRQADKFCKDSIFDTDTQVWGWFLTFHCQYGFYRLVAWRTFGGGQTF